MRLKVVATTFAVIAATGLLALPADAAPKKKVAVVDSRGHTVFTSRDEDGKTRTRIIIQKRSYLDPGTETFPGENIGGGYAQLPTQHATERARQHGHRRHKPGSGARCPARSRCRAKTIPGSAILGRERFQLGEDRVAHFRR